MGPKVQGTRHEGAALGTRKAPRRTREVSATSWYQVRRPLGPASLHKFRNLQGFLASFEQNKSYQTTFYDKIEHINET